MQISHRAGFSLIEALVVLAIGGMALAVIFSIGLKAGNSGFTLGRKAMAASDLDVAHNDIRTLIQSFELRPRQGYVLASDIPLNGSATSFEGQVVLKKSTGCAPRGWAGTARLSIVKTDKDQQLICNMGGQEQALHVWPSGSTARFSYSRNGETWYDHIPELPPLDPELLSIPSHTLWIRFTTGRDLTIIDRVTSGRADTWRRTDAQL